MSTTNYSIDPSLYSDSALLGSSSAHQHAQPSEPMSAPQLDELHIPQQSDVDNLLRKKRKAREHKACYPCRQRKVKCDLSRPCQTCNDREHPELCDYNPPNKRQMLDPAALRSEDGPTHGSSAITIGQSEFDLLCQKLNGIEQSIVELRRELGRDSRAIDPALTAAVAGLSSTQPVHNHIDLHGLYQTNEGGYVRQFGAGSIPTMLQALKSPHNDDTQRHLRDRLNKSIMPPFGLDADSATYPFIDLWDLPRTSQDRVNELARVLPDDQQALAFINSYKSLAHLIFPALADLDRFVGDSHEFLVNRAAQIDSVEAITEQSIYGKSYYWLGLLFAVLASGAQSSTMPRKQRELTSQVYICCAMECCRITTFLSRGNIETIQTLLIVQNVLSNSMSAGTAWTMLGLTIRLAQGQGLNQPCPPDVPAEHAFERSRVWWAIVWQDSMLSIIYDRAGTDHLVGDKAMPMPMRYRDVSSYHSAMYKLAKVTLDIVRSRGLHPDLHEQASSSKIDNFHAEIDTILQSSANHLQDHRQCQSMQESIEYWALYLHSSFALAELCRPALSSLRGAQVHRDLCIRSLINTIDAYLGLQDVTAYARQSWATIHRALSSALLLGIVGEHNHDARVRHLLARFVSTMQEITASIDPAEIAAPLQRGIDALHKLDLLKATVDDGSKVAEATQRRSHDSLTLNGVFGSPSDPHADKDQVSPHAILKNILWGVDSLAGKPTASPMPW